MPYSKEDHALRWAQASDEEKSERRKRNAEAQRKCRARKEKKSVTEMSSEEKERKRALDRKDQKKKRANMTEEEREANRAKDRQRKKKYRIQKKEKESEDKVKMKHAKHSDLDNLEGKKDKQQKNNCRIQRKIRNERTSQEKEKVNANLADRFRERQEMMTSKGKQLARLRAKLGMRVCRKFGYLRKYKQRKIRDDCDPYMFARIGVDKNGYSSLSQDYQKKQDKIIRKFRKKLEKDEKTNRKDSNKKEELREKSRIRVQRHRKKVKKMLQEPVILEENSEKGPYELLRENNIKEFDRLKKASGLFD